jgi:hypothetical protein
MGANPGFAYKVKQYENKRKSQVRKPDFFCALL